MTPIESFKINEGYDRTGTHTELSFEGDQIVKKQTYDAEPFIEAAAQARIATAGDKWGDGHHVGYIPAPVLSDIFSRFSGSEERKHQILVWLRDNPKMVTFDKFLL